MKSVSRNDQRSQNWLLISLLLISLIASYNIALARRVAGYPTIEVAFDAPDSSVELVGYLSLPTPDRAKPGTPPLVVLLHQTGESSEVWGGYIDDLIQSGFAAFTLDLRGFGLSTFDLKTQRVRPKNTYFVGERLKLPDDVAFLVDKAIKTHHDKFDTTRIAVIGAGLGANTGILYAFKEPRVKYIAMISPGLDFDGLRTVPVLREYGDRPVFLAYGDKDVYSKGSVDLISDLVPRVLDIQEYPSMFSGNRLFNASFELRTKVLNDIKKYFAN